MYIKKYNDIILIKRDVKETRIMIRFECDYAEGAHPRVLEFLTKTNFEQTPGYSVDPYCEKARGIIKKLCQSDRAEVHFLVGGTQANTIVIESILRPHQGVVSAETGHISVHETGAIEATGHKVLTLPSEDGKITAAQVREVYESHWNDPNAEHTVQPGMVYISNPTENGTLYTKKELTELSEACRSLGLPLFLDGARMGYGLAAEGNDLALADIARLCDVFYIGGTKVGALFGEAVVITDPSLQKDFRYMIKQHGGLLAKGRLLGIQFMALLEDGLYFEISEHADRMAMKIKAAFEEKGYAFLYESATNQQFPIIPDDKLEVLKKKYAYSFWKRVDDQRSAVRFCTSWATREEDVELLLEDIRSL
ncbi:MAG: ltaE [Firmicutes bacterium]|nr:ltaE [Bacillota bacterium]